MTTYPIGGYCSRCGAWPCRCPIRVQEMLRPKMAVAMNPLDVTDAIRRECKARNVPLKESPLVERGKAFVMDLEKLEAGPMEGRSQ